MTIPGDQALCAVCGEPANFRCDRSRSVSHRVGLRNLRRGDVVLANRDELRRPQTYRVVGLSLILRPTRRAPVMFAYVDLLRHGAALAGTLKVPGRRNLLIRRMEPCGTAVCFRHVRELAENRHWCDRCIREAA